MAAIDQAMAATPLTPYPGRLRFVFKLDNYIDGGYDPQDRFEILMEQWKLEGYLRCSIVLGNNGELDKGNILLTTVDHAMAAITIYRAKLKKVENENLYRIPGQYIDPDINWTITVSGRGGRELGPDARSWDHHCRHILPEGILGRIDQWIATDDEGKPENTRVAFIAFNTEYNARSACTKIERTGRYRCTLARSEAPKAAGEKDDTKETPVVEVKKPEAKVGWWDRLKHKSGRRIAKRTQKYLDEEDLA